MFKNATFARIAGLPTHYTADQAARCAQFVPTGPTQEHSIGWTPPRDAYGAWVESIGGHWIMAATIETRTVPPKTLDKHVDKLADAVERETGRKPGKKARRELKEQARLELLPHAFPRQTRVLVWIDPAAGRVVLDTASAARADEVVSLIGQSLGSVSIKPVNTQMNPATLMNCWVHDREPDYDEFTIGRACELRAPDGEKATVRYTNTDVLTDETRAHIKAGLSVTQLALSWVDKANFTLTDGLALRKVEITDVGPSSAPAADAFDADVAILTGTLGPLLDDLIEVLGGEVEA